MISPHITESVNPLTRFIDIADPVGMTRQLRQSDAQLFSGWGDWPSMMDEEILERLAQSAWAFAQHIKKPDSIIAFSGAGTSGRLANLLTTEFNRYLKEKGLPQVFRALIAGGPAALIQAQESAEDHAQMAVKDFKAILTDEVAGGVYVGITCGLSATYVASQLDFIGGDARFTSILVGFNPAAGARSVSIEGWDKTVKDVVDHALESERFIMLNPVVGPEPITGSTRMKGGSATKMLMDIVFAVAMLIIENEKKEGAEKLAIAEDNLLPLRAPILDLVRRYQDAIQSAYINTAELAELVRLGGTALRSGGRIHYIGRGSAGVLGLIDASECPPTYGADLFDVRGYVFEGWEMLGYTTTSMSSRGKAFEIGHDYFEKNVLLEVTKGDFVVGVAIGQVGENTKRLLALAAKNKASTALILITTEKPKASDLPEGLATRCIVVLDRLGFAAGMNCEAEIALKICLNALTTGAHILAGKVYGNVMIDLRISNNKLYYRSVNLISNLLNVSKDEARRAIYHAVFKAEPTAEELESTPIAAYIQRAVSKPKVIPTAILLATRKFSYSEAEERLAGEPRVRRIIEELITPVAGANG